MSALVFLKNAAFKTRVSTPVISLYVKTAEIVLTFSQPQNAGNRQLKEHINKS